MNPWLLLLVLLLYVVLSPILCNDISNKQKRQNVGIPYLFDGSLLFLDRRGRCSHHSLGVVAFFSVLIRVVFCPPSFHSCCTAQHLILLHLRSDFSAYKSLVASSLGQAGRKTQTGRKYIANRESQRETTREPEGRLYAASPRSKDELGSSRTGDNKHNHLSRNNHNYNYDSHDSSDNNNNKDNKSMSRTKSWTMICFSTIM